MLALQSQAVDLFLSQVSPHSSWGDCCFLVGYSFENIIFGARRERIHLIRSFIPSLSHTCTRVPLPHGQLSVRTHTHTPHIAFWVPPITLGLIKHPGGLFLNTLLIDFWFSFFFNTLTAAILNSIRWMAKFRGGGRAWQPSGLSSMMNQATLGIGWRKTWWQFPRKPDPHHRLQAPCQSLDELHPSH